VELLPPVVVGKDPIHVSVEILLPAVESSDHKNACMFSISGEDQSF
jgi:hypothetical protein